MTKAKVIKAKVSARKKKRTSKGAIRPWEVWDIEDDGYHHPQTDFPTKVETEEAIKKHSYWIAPVIVHIDIPPMEY